MRCMSKRGKIITLILATALFALSGAKGVFADGSYTPSGINGKIWMNYIPDYASISQINVPGSHDAATCGVKLIGAHHWLVTQSETVKDQLDFGVRLLDIRIDASNQKDDMVICHGPADCYRSMLSRYYYSDLLSDCKSFLDKNPTETVLMSVQQETDNRESHQDKYDKLWNRYLEQFENDERIIYLTKDSVIPLLGECRGKIVIFKSDCYKKTEDHDTVKESRKIEFLEKIWKQSKPQHYEDDGVFYKSPSDEDYTSDPLVVFSSCRNGDSGLPKRSYKNVHKFIEGKYSSSQYKLQQGYYYGWCFNNFSNEDVTKAYYKTNKFIDPSDQDNTKIYWGYNDTTLTLSSGKTSQTPNSFYKLSRFVSAKAVPWALCKNMTEVHSLDTIEPQYLDNWFKGCTSLEIVDADIDSKNLISMNSAFSGCTSLKIVVNRQFKDTSKLKECNELFKNDSALESVYVGGADVDFTQAAKNSANVFDNCGKLKGSFGTTISAASDSRTLARVDTQYTSKKGVLSYLEPSDVYWGIQNGELVLANYYTKKTPNKLSYDSSGNPSWFDKRKEIKSVTVKDVIAPETTKSWFRGMENAEEFDLELLDTSNVKNMWGMFDECKSVNELDLSGFSSDKLEMAYYMFYDCVNLETVYADPSFRLPAGDNSSQAFYNCRMLVGGQYTQYDPNEINGDRGRIDRALVTSAPEAGYFSDVVRFYWGVSDNTLYLSAGANDKTPNEFKDRYTTDIQPWAAYRQSIKYVSILNRMSPKYMCGWFEYLNNVESIDLSKIDTKNTISMYRCFMLSGIKELDISNFSSAKLKDVYECFSNMKNLEVIYSDSDFDLRSLTDSKYVFYRDTKLIGAGVTKYADIGEAEDDITWAVCEGKGGEHGLFTNKSKPVDNLMYWGISGDTLYIDNKSSETFGCTKKLYDDLRIYISAPWYLQRESIKKVKVLDKISPVYTYAWFYGLTNATEFDLAKMDTSNTVNMSEMFMDVKSCEILDISSFSAESLTSAKDMFSGCENLKTIYANSDFDLRNLDGVRMFSHCRELVGGYGTRFSDYGKITSDFAVCDTRQDRGYFSEDCEFYWGVKQIGVSDGCLYISSHYDSDKTPNLAKNRPYTDESPAPWMSNVADIKRVEVLDKVSLKYMDGLFSGLLWARSFDTDKLDTSCVKSMKALFKGCSSAEELHLEYFENNGILNADEMFAGCTSLKTIYANPYFCLTSDMVSAVDIFDNCLNLKGGKGTTFDPAHQKDRACADEPDYEPGYFTAKLRSMESDVTVSDFIGDYDGNPHMIDVSLTGEAKGASVFYSLSASSYGSLEGPSIIDEGEYTVYYRVVQYGYEEVTGSAKVTIKSLELGDADVYCPSTCDFTYDGQNHTFDITLKNAAEGAYLDYECSSPPEKEEMSGGQIMPFWSKAGVYDITVIVVKDHYKEYRTHTTVTIAPKEFDPSDIEAVGYSGEYDGRYHTVNITLKGEAEGATVYYAPEGSDYSTVPVMCRDVNESVKVNYKITKENYEDYCEDCDISISQKELNSDNLILQKTEYGRPSGSTDPVEVLYRVVCGNAVLTKDTGDGTGDYRVISGDKETEKGPHTLKIEGMGNYTGEITADWEIVDRSIGDYLEIEEVHTDYDGLEHTININVLPGPTDCTLSYGVFPSGSYSPDKPSYSDAGVYVIKYRAETTDTSFESEDRSVEGTAVVEIMPRELEDANLAITPVSAMYNEKVHSVDYGVMWPIDDGALLTEGVDYEIVSATTDAIDVGQYLIAVNGKGNYSGYAKGTWEIVEGDMSDGITVEGCEAEYDKKGHSITVTLKDAAAGAKVLYSTDGVSYTYENPDFTEIGTHTVYYKISKKGYTEVPGSETVTIKRIQLAEDDVLVVSTYNVYSGSEIEPEIYVYRNNAELVRDVDYEVSGEKSETSVGNYCLQVTGKGDFDGIVDIKWAIVSEDSPTIEYDIFSDEYDGQPHASYLVIPDSLKGNVTVTYGMSSEKCTDDKPYMQTDAGIFMCWGKVTFNDGSISPYKTELFGIVKQRIVTVAADNKSKHKGEADPALTYSVDRLIAGDEINGVSVYREAGEEVGNYAINVEVDPTQNSNYYVLTEEGTFTVKEPRKDDPHKDDPKRDNPWKYNPWGVYSSDSTSGSSSSQGTSEKRTYTVSFDVNGGYYVNPITVTEGEVIDFTGIFTFKADAEFAGWYLDKDLTNKVLQLQVAGNTTIYAGWNAVERRKSDAAQTSKSSAPSGSVQQSAGNKTTSKDASGDGEMNKDTVSKNDKDAASNAGRKSTSNSGRGTGASGSGQGGAQDTQKRAPAIEMPVYDDLPVIDNTPAIDDVENEDGGLPLPVKIGIALGGALAAGGGAFLIWKKRR